MCSLLLLHYYLFIYYSMSDFIFCYHCIPALDDFVLTYVLLSYHLFFPFLYNMSWLLLAYPIIFLLSPQIFVSSFFSTPCISTFISYFPFLKEYLTIWHCCLHFSSIKILYSGSTFIKALSLVFLFYCPMIFVFFFLLYHLIYICKCMMIYFLHFEKQEHSWTSIHLTYFRFLQH